MLGFNCAWLGWVLPFVRFSSSLAFDCYLVLRYLGRYFKNIGISVTIFNQATAYEDANCLKNSYAKARYLTL